MATAALLGNSPYDDVVSPGSPCSLGVGSFIGVDFLIPGDTILGVGLIDAPVPYCSADTLPAIVASINSVTVTIQAAGGSGNGGGSNTVVTTVTRGVTVAGTPTILPGWFGYSGPTHWGETFTVDPITGLPWTRANLVNTGFGLRWSAVGGNMTTCNVWGMWVVVDYEPAVMKEANFALSTAPAMSLVERTALNAQLDLDSAAGFAPRLGSGLVIDVPTANRWELQRVTLRPSKQGG